MSKLLTAEQLGEVRERTIEWLLIGWHDHSSVAPIISDNRSLLEHIDALQGEMDSINECLDSHPSDCDCGLERLRRCRS